MKRNQQLGMGNTQNRSKNQERVMDNIQRMRTSSRTSVDWNPTNLSRSLVVRYVDETLQDDDTPALWKKTKKRYKIIDRLGEGAMGKVFRVCSLKDHKIYALKRIQCKDTEELNSAVMEIIVTKSIDHDNVVNYHDVYMETFGSIAVLCIAMPLFSTDLHKLLMERRSREQPFREIELLYIMNQIASGLRVMHQRKLMHRDLKPANIFVAAMDQFPYASFKVGDFGLTSRKHETDTKFSICGTRWYMAAEVYSKSYSFPIDIYSLGATVIELALLEHLSFSISMTQMTDGEDSVFRQLRDQLAVNTERMNYSEAFIDLMFNCLKLDPSTRPTTDMLVTTTGFMIDQFIQQGAIIEFEIQKSDIDSSSTNSESFSELIMRSDDSASTSDSDMLKLNLTSTDVTLSGVTMSSFATTTTKTGTDLSDVTENRYRHDKRLGNRAWIGIDNFTETKVVLKKIYLEHDPEYALDELVMMTALKHPHIVHLKDAYFNSGTDDSQKYVLNIVMDYFPEGSLDVYLKKRYSRNEPITFHEILIMYYQLALALNYLHSSGIIHRAISPMNILVHHDNDSRLHVKLIEFGTAIFLDDKMDQVRTFNKTSLSMGVVTLPPEETKSDPNQLCFQTDMYYLANTIFKVSTLESIVRNNINTSLLFNDQKSYEKVKNKTILSDRVFNLVVKSLAENPFDRPDDQTVLTTLEEILSQEKLSDYIQPHVTN